jgi:hypothetical protein
MDGKSADELLQEIIALQAQYIRTIMHTPVHAPTPARAPAAKSTGSRILAARRII